MAEGKSRLAAIGGVVALLTGVVGLAGASVSLFDRFKPNESDAPAVEKLEGAPAVIDGYMSGPAFVDLWTKSLFCLDYDAANTSCEVVLSLQQRGPRNVRSRETRTASIEGAMSQALGAIVEADAAGRGQPTPAGMGHVETIDYEITREGICTTNAALEKAAATVDAYAFPPGDAPQVPLTAASLTKFRAELAVLYRNLAVGEQCWRYRQVPGKANDLVGDYFIDGVRQPDDTVTWKVLPKDAEVGWHLPKAG